MRTHTNTGADTAHYSAEVAATSAAHTALPLEADQSVLLLLLLFALMNYRRGDEKRRWRVGGVKEESGGGEGVGG